MVMLKQTAEPGARREVMRRLPQGVRYLLSRSSPKNARTRSEAYPASLRFAELAGIASAPVALKRSRVRTATEV
jgi:hypothetical protein